MVTLTAIFIEVAFLIESGQFVKIFGAADTECNIQYARQDTYYSAAI